MKDTKYLVVFVTVPSKEIGERMARSLVEAKLAAGVNLLPEVNSIYTWEGEVCYENEVLMIIKTQAKFFEILAESVRTMHPYEVPEIIALPIVAGDPNYLTWIAAVTR
jgi:periplasmic divalent cation tolerance protein